MDDESPKIVGSMFDGDWTEDFPHENGTYYCKCCICAEQFIGHKRRVTCKICAVAEDQQHDTYERAQQVSMMVGAKVRHDEAVARWKADAQINEMLSEKHPALKGNKNE